jgi:excisionase family DNA binding protein
VKQDNFLDAHVRKGKKMEDKKTEIPTRRYLRVKAAADYLGFSPWKVRELIASGKLPYMQDGDSGPFMLDIKDLDAFMEKHKNTRTGT